MKSRHDEGDGGAVAALRNRKTLTPDHEEIVRRMRKMHYNVSEEERNDTALTQLICDRAIRRTA